MFSLKTDRQTGIQTDGKRLMGRQTDRQTDRQYDRQTDGRTESERKRMTLRIL